MNSEKYPSWPKGLPWKGSRSLVAAPGFKSLLLRSRNPLESRKIEIMLIKIFLEPGLKKVPKMAKKPKFDQNCKKDMSN